jgi:cell division protein FtsN
LNALKSAGYNNAFVELENGWWKVRLGPYTKKNAEKQVAKLEKDGFSAIIVKVK